MLPKAFSDLATAAPVRTFFSNPPKPFPKLFPLDSPSPSNCLPSCSLIPCADGGASLLQWREGGLLFDHALYQARLANRTSTVAGILWHQGEAECAPENYPLAEARLRALIAAFRREPCLAEAPFILGGLGDFLPLRKETPNLRNALRVNAALQAVADDAQRIGFVSAQGLSSNPDLLHFNAPSLREFGLRYYAVFQRLEDKGRVFLEKSAPDDAVRTEMELL